MMIVQCVSVVDTGAKVDMKNMKVTKEIAGQIELYRSGEEK